MFENIKASIKHQLFYEDNGKWHDVEMVTIPEEELPPRIREKIQKGQMVDVTDEIEMELNENEINFCPYCGAKVRNKNARFCTSCGKSLSD